jgi:hypothetical protein
MEPRCVQLIQDGRIETSGLFDPTLRYADDYGLVAEVENLIAKGYAFVHAHGGWPPAAVLADLQERRLLTMPFVAITWTAPGKFEIFRVVPP